MLVEAQDRAGRPIAILCAGAEGDAVTFYADPGSIHPFAADGRRVG